MKSRPATRMAISSLQEQIGYLEKAILATHKLIKEKKDIIIKLEKDIDENP